MNSFPHTHPWPSLHWERWGWITEACVGVSCKYMLVLLLIKAMLPSKPINHLFQERRLLFSSPIAGFLCISLLHSRISWGDTDISAPRSVCEMEHVNLKPDDFSSLKNGLLTVLCERHSLAIGDESADSNVPIWKYPKWVVYITLHVSLYTNQTSAL